MKSKKSPHAETTQGQISKEVRQTSKANSSQYSRKTQVLKFGSSCISCDYFQQNKKNIKTSSFCRFTGERVQTSSRACNFMTCGGAVYE